MCEFSTEKLGDRDILENGLDQEPFEPRASKVHLGSWMFPTGKVAVKFEKTMVPKISLVQTCDPQYTQRRQEDEGGYKE